jgi:hypothetical protein
MMNKIVIIALVLGLVGCQSPEQERQQINQRLPPGCEFKYVGEYQNNHIAIVRCDGRAATTTNLWWRSGKTTYHSTTALLDDVDR